MELFLIVGGIWFLSYIYQYNRKAQRDYMDSKNLELHDTIMKEVREVVNEEVSKVLDERKANQ